MWIYLWYAQHIVIQYTVIPLILNGLRMSSHMHYSWTCNGIYTCKDAIYKHENKWATERTGLQVICFSISGGNEKLFAMKKGFFAIET